MGYGKTMEALQGYRADHGDALLGLRRHEWFPERWDSLGKMLDDLRSDDENAEISRTYKDGEYAEIVRANLELDYVCGMRRDIRRQYISDEADPKTDVVPFRYAITTMDTAMMFDKLTERVYK